MVFSSETTATLVLGTTNRGKLAELEALLLPHGLNCVSLRGIAGAVTVEETGDSFAANAALKASQQAAALGRWVLAEDSGLVVKALGGAPGIFSARFSGPTATDADNNSLLLERLAETPSTARTAHYACHAALADPSGTIQAIASGACHGLIAMTASGTGGFGYDPLFIVPEYHRTFGDISPAVKSIISHRGRAMRAMLPEIIRCLRPSR